MQGIIDVRHRARLNYHAVCDVPKAEVRRSFITTTARPRSHHKGATGRVRTGGPYIFDKAFVRRSFTNHDCSGTASQHTTSMIHQCQYMTSLYYPLCMSVHTFDGRQNIRIGVSEPFIVFKDLKNAQRPLSGMHEKKRYLKSFFESYCSCPERKS